jgi:hypothetical protein
MEDEITKGAVLGLIAGLRDSYSRFWLKRRLRKMLKFPKFKWRSMKELSAAVGQNDTETKKLLVEINARPQAGNPDMWGLESRIGSH